METEVFENHLFKKVFFNANFIDKINLAYMTKFYMSSKPIKGFSYEKAAFYILK